jgi:sugar phosphate isomerase/epimerase
VLELADGTLTPDLPIARRELDRMTALGLLDDAVVPEDSGLDAANWPIGAAMLQFPSIAPGGSSVREAGPEYWHRQLRRMKREGFDVVEIPSAWLPIADMRSAERRDLAAILEELEMAICATSMVRMSVIDPDPRRADENLEATHRGIDAAAEVGSPLVCLGLHEALYPEQTAIPWFWTVPGPANPPDRVLWDRAVARFQELSDHARAVNVQLSLEVYEGTFLGDADSAVSFISDVDRDNIGVNPDLGNLTRPQSPIEPWEAMAVKLLPIANYWHVKNYSRIEDPLNELYYSVPAMLPVGLIDYRKAVRFALANGFRGAFLSENYGGDGLGVSAENARYLRRLIADAIEDGR